VPRALGGAARSAQDRRVQARASRRKKVIHAKEAFALPPDRALRVVAVADTHSQPDPRSRELIVAERPDRILHAGDIGALAVLDDLADVAPVTAVRGNIDAQTPGVPDLVTIDVKDGDRTILTLLLMHIALYGPKLRADALRFARSAHAQMIVCGHSHVPFIGRDHGIAVINPGSIGPRRFQLPIVFGVIEIGRDKVAMHHVSCETGRPWLP
jgi:putative phosphoesterase